MKRGALVVLLLLVPLVMAPELVSAQCAMCKTVLTGSEEGRTMAGELNRAIVMMIFAPYLVFGTIAAVLFRKPLAARLSLLRDRLRGRTTIRDAAAS